MSLKDDKPGVPLEPRKTLLERLGLKKGANRDPHGSAWLYLVLLAVALGIVGAVLIGAPR